MYAKRRREGEREADKERERGVEEGHGMESGGSAKRSSVVPDIVRELDLAVSPPRSRPSID